jgi:hypothetical protein
MALVKPFPPSWSAFRWEAQLTSLVQGCSRSASAKPPDYGQLLASADSPALFFYPDEGHQPPSSHEIAPVHQRQQHVDRRSMSVHRGWVVLRVEAAQDVPRAEAVRIL